MSTTTPTHPHSPASPHPMENLRKHPPLPVVQRQPEPPAEPQPSVSAATTALTPPPANTAIAAAPSVPFVPVSARISGFDEQDFVMPRAHIFQGLPIEREKIGPFNTGDVINMLTGERLFNYDASTKVLTGDNTLVIVRVFHEWVCWPKDQVQPVYRLRNKWEVPPEDLIFPKDASGKSMPPNASENIIVIALFKAFMDFPLAITIKRKSLNAGRILITREKLRGNRGPGLYALEFKKMQNEKGAWISPEFRSVGDPPADLVDTSSVMAASFSDNVRIADEVAASDEAAAASAANPGNYGEPNYGAGYDDGSSGVI